MRIQPLNNNQQKPSFGLSYVPNELVPRFTVLVEGCNREPLNKLAEGEYFQILAKSLRHVYEKKILQTHTAFLNFREANMIDNLGITAKFNPTKENKKLITEGIKQIFRKPKIWSSGDIEKLEEEMAVLTPNNIQTRYMLLQKHNA